MAFPNEEKKISYSWDFVLCVSVCEGGNDRSDEVMGCMSVNFESYDFGCRVVCRRLGYVVHLYLYLSLAHFRQRSKENNRGGLLFSED